MKEETAQLFILTCILLIYMLIGAAIFSALELENEKKLKLSYERVFEQFSQYNNISAKLMAKFKAAHREACLLGLMDDEIKRWDYVGSFYFVGTVITTIGFGLTAPSTFYGQLFFIFYGIVGIPLNILFLNTALERIVTKLSQCLRSLSKHIPKNKFLKPIGPREFPSGYVLLATVWIFIITTLALSGIFAHLEDWNLFESIYFVIVACSTVGFGDYVPSKAKTRVGHNIHPGYVIGNWLLICFGVVVTYVALNLIANYMKKALKFATTKSSKRFFPCITNSVDVIDTKGAGGNEPTSRPMSRMSIASDASIIDVGSFAAIQMALDKMRKKAEQSPNEGFNEIKALSTIESLLRNEFKRTKERQGNTAKARWKRAAAKARRNYRQAHAKPRSRRTSTTSTLERSFRPSLGVTNLSFDAGTPIDVEVHQLQSVSVTSHEQQKSENNNSSKVKKLSTGNQARAQQRIGELEITDF